MMEVYVDDMLVKRLYIADHLTHLTEMFNLLYTYNMKLNPNKCAFGIFSKKFLGFTVNQRCIEANPNKIKVMLKVEAPWTTKKVQQLTKNLVVVNRFMFTPTNKCFPFFQILRKASKFEWTPKHKTTFAQLKVI